MTETPGPGAGAPAEEYRQLQRRLTEQVLYRAASDPQWRQWYLEDPKAATAEFPEAQRLRRMEEEVYIPYSRKQRLRRIEEGQRRSRNLNEKVLDKAASDPEWKQLLLSDPEAAMRQLSSEVAEVRGQVETFEVETFMPGSLNLLWGRRYYDVWFPTIPTDTFYPPDPI
jgi:hypothetical protein